MRYLAGLSTVCALALASAAPVTAGQVAVTAGATARAQAFGVSESLAGEQARITGRVTSRGGTPVANATVRARSLVTGQIAGSSSTDSAGQFAIIVHSGSYILEVVDTAGQIIATSPFIAAAAGNVAATTLTVTAGALSSFPPAAGLASTLTTSMARNVAYAAAAAGVAGVVTPAEVVTASPSR
jgi:hypothetical protein